METIIGLGSAGCNIADQFAKYPQYEIYKIDEGAYTGTRKDANMLSVTKQNSHQEYEANTPDLNSFLHPIKGKILFIVGGSGNISGMALSALSQIRHCELNILYVEPDLTLLSGDKKLQERATYYILQEYTRSGAFKRIFLISNPQLENILGNVPIIGYNDRLNELIVSTMHMINVFNNVDSVVDNFSEPREQTRISTIGVSSLDDEKKLFFPLDSIREIRYYFAINEEKLKSDGTLMRRITENIADKEEIDVSYGVFSTDYPENYVYCVANASLIQYRENEKKSLQI